MWCSRRDPCKDQCFFDEDAFLLSQPDQRFAKGGFRTVDPVDAGVAELVDAPDLGSGAYGVGVRVPSPAPFTPFFIIF